MRYFPLFLDLRDRPVLVVGGGRVAERKVGLLLAAGACPTVVAPEVTAPLAVHSHAGRLAHRPRVFTASDVDGCTLAIAATGTRAVNAEVAAACRARNVPVNVVDDAQLSTFIVPAIIDRSPVQVAVSTGGAAPVLARALRERLEALLDESLGALAEFAADWRARVRAALPEAGARRRFVRWMLEGPAAARLRSGRRREADVLIEEALAAARRPSAAPGWGPVRAPDIAPGTVTLVGAGPGDPGLLTLKALRALQEADVILHDRLVSAAVLALARRDATFMNVGKIPGDRGSAQLEIEQRMVALARQGLRVVRLKGGDPLVFARGGEELEALRAAGIPYEVIPGITAAFGCAAYAGIPLTDRRAAHAVTFATGHDEAALEALGALCGSGATGTLALYMGVATLAALSRELRARGFADDTPAALVENGSTPAQRVIVATLGTLAEAAQTHAVRSPAMTFIGAAAAQAVQLHWFGAEPLVHAAGDVGHNEPPTAALRARV